MNISLFTFIYDLWKESPVLSNGGKAILKKGFAKMFLAKKSFLT